MTIFNNIKELSATFREISETVATDVLRSIGPKEKEIGMTEFHQGITRNQVIAKVLTTVIGVAASFTITYFGVKWLTDAMDPTKKGKKEAQAEAQRMLAKLGVEDVGKLSDYELCVAANLLDVSTMSVTWDSIGGLENTIQDIQETVILPFKRTDLFRHSSLLQPPKGILLYGPPGCGKTMIAKATARAAGARFINLQVSTLVDKWYGESQKRAEAVFSLADKLQPTIIFIDEIDSFLRARSSTDHEATAMMKTQFMSLWDGLTTDPNCRIMIMGATNRVQDVDAAILRRMPCQFYVGMPEQAQRDSILRLILRNENVEGLDYSILSRLSEGLSGSDLREVCRTAAVAVVHDYVQRQSHSRNSTEGGGDELRRISMDDLQIAIHKVRSSKRLSSQQGVPLD